MDGLLKQKMEKKLSVLLLDFFILNVGLDKIYAYRCLRHQKIIRWRLGYRNKKKFSDIGYRNKNFDFFRYYWRIIVLEPHAVIEPPPQSHFGYMEQ